MQSGDEGGDDGGDFLNKSNFVSRVHNQKEVCTFCHIQMALSAFCHQENVCKVDDWTCIRNSKCSVDISESQVDRIS